MNDDSNARIVEENGLKYQIADYQDGVEYRWISEAEYCQYSKLRKETEDNPLVERDENGNVFIDEFVIPTTLDGRPVRQIGEYALELTLFHIRNLVLPENLMSIAYSSFGCCAIIDRSRLPRSLQQVDGTFLTNVTQIEIDDDHPNFCVVDGVVFSRDMTRLVGYPRTRRDATYCVPESVQVIGKYAFGDNEYLREIVLPNGVKKIEDYAFCGCGSLERINLPESVEFLANGAFSCCNKLVELIVPANVREIGGDSLIWLKRVKLATNHPYFKIIDGVLFTKDGKKLIGYPIWKKSKTYRIPNGVEEIGYYAFYSNRHIQKIVCSQTVRRIGERAFAGCWRVREIILPGRLDFLGAFALECNSKLRRVILPKVMPETDWDFMFLNCHALEEVRLPENMTKVGDSTFFDCKSLRTVHLPDSVQIINEVAFYGCRKLIDMQLPQKLKFIGDGAFRSCRALKKLELPFTLEEMGEEPFDARLKLSAPKGSWAEQWIKDNSGGEDGEER